MTRMALVVLAAIALPACASESPPSRVASLPATQPQRAPTNLVRVPMVRKGSSVFTVQVGISGVCCFPFMLDSGASDVSVPPRIFRAMVKDGVVTKDDLIDVVKYRTAGGTVDGIRFRMPPLTVGGLTVYGVLGSVSPSTPDGMLLLGQSFLNRFEFYAIDNQTHELVLGGVR